MTDENENGLAPQRTGKKPPNIEPASIPSQIKNLGLI